MSFPLSSAFSKWYAFTNFYSYFVHLSCFKFSSFLVLFIYVPVGESAEYMFVRVKQNLPHCSAEQ